MEKTAKALEFDEDCLMCPISCEVMTDPVILIGDGHSYDRKSIKEWLDQGNRISPFTGEKLSSTDIQTNHALRYAIQQTLKIAPEQVRKTAKDERTHVCGNSRVVADREGVSLNPTCHIHKWPNHCANQQNTSRKGS